MLMVGGWWMSLMGEVAKLRRELASRATGPGEVYKLVL